MLAGSGPLSDGIPEPITISKSARKMPGLPRGSVKIDVDDTVPMRRPRCVTP